jgi:hypothetical protein
MAAAAAKERPALPYTVRNEYASATEMSKTLQLHTQQQQEAKKQGRCEMKCLNAFVMKAASPKV